MKNKVLENIKKYNLINPKDTIIVGVSGGVDSVVLLHVLNELKSNVDFKLKAVHVNHNIRGQEAIRDEEMVKKYCDKLGVELEIAQVMAVEHAQKHKLTLEQAARNLRYNVFKNKINGEANCKIAVAHNKDDQAETILMHIFRGCGISGASGMKFESRGIIRPILSISRTEIENYANEHGLNYVVDSSNKDSKYVRNFIRNEVLPKIEAAYPSARANIVSFGSKLLDVENMIKSKLNYSLINKVSSTEFLLNNEARLEREEELKLLIRECFNLLNFGVDIEEKHINKVIDLFDMQVGKELHFPNCIKAIKSRQGIVFISDEKKLKVNEKPFNSSQVINSLYGEIVVEKVDSYNRGDGNLYADLQTIPSNAIWREIKRGDKILKFSGGFKLISDFLTDKKIDSATRKKMLVLADGREVLIIPGVEISSKLKITNSTKEVVRICLKK